MPLPDVITLFLMKMLKIALIIFFPHEKCPQWHSSQAQQPNTTFFLDGNNATLCS
jgi:hypothetical protein